MSIKIKTSASHIKFSETKINELESGYYSKLVSIFDKLFK